MTSNDDKVNYLGIGVLIVGVVLLFATFYLAYSAFTNPEAIANFSQIAPTVEGEAGQIIGPIFQILTYFIAIFLIWVMGSVSGRIAKQGLNMYRKSVDEEVKGTDSEKEDNESLEDKEVTIEDSEKEEKEARTPEKGD